MKKKYKAGFFLGRMQPLPHKGHMELINKGIELCDNFLVIVGSAQEYDTRKNPASFMQRKSYLNQLYQHEIKIRGIHDRPDFDINEWNDFLLAVATEGLGQKPEVMIVGKEDSNRDFYNDWTLNIDIVEVDRTITNISGTEIRNAISLDDKDKFDSFIDKRLHVYYDNIRYAMIRNELNIASENLLGDLFGDKIDSSIKFSKHTL